MAGVGSVANKNIKTRNLKNTGKNINMGGVESWKCGILQSYHTDVNSCTYAIFLVKNNLLTEPTKTRVSAIVANAKGICIKKEVWMPF